MNLVNREILLGLSMLGCFDVLGASDSAQTIAREISVHPGYEGNDLAHDLYAWRLLQANTAAQCFDLANVCVSCLSQVGVEGYADAAWPSVDGTPVWNKVNAQGPHFQNIQLGSCVQDLKPQTLPDFLVPEPVYLGLGDSTDRFEGFFYVPSQGKRYAYTAYPFMGPFDDDDGKMYYKVLKATVGATPQRWIASAPFKIRDGTGKWYIFNRGDKITDKFKLIQDVQLP